MPAPTNCPRSARTIPRLNAPSAAICAWMVSDRPSSVGCSTRLRISAVMPRPGVEDVRLLALDHVVGQVLLAALPLRDAPGVHPGEVLGAEPEDADDQLRRHGVGELRHELDPAVVDEAVDEAVDDLLDPRAVAPDARGLEQLEHAVAPGLVVRRVQLDDVLHHAGGRQRVLRHGLGSRPVEGVQPLLAAAGEQVLPAQDELDVLVVGDEVAVLADLVHRARFADPGQGRERALHLGDRGVVEPLRVRLHQLSSRDGPHRPAGQVVNGIPSGQRPDARARTSFRWRRAAAGRSGSERPRAALGRAAPPAARPDARAARVVGSSRRGTRTTP